MNWPDFLLVSVQVLIGSVVVGTAGFVVRTLWREAGPK